MIFFYNFFKWPPLVYLFRIGHNTVKGRRVLYLDPFTRNDCVFLSFCKPITENANGMCDRVFTLTEINEPINCLPRKMGTEPN